MDGLYPEELKAKETSHPVYEEDMANALRFLAADMVERAQSGHPGMPMGFADVFTVLYRHFLKFNPNAPTWPNRDRLILSGGHGCALHYAALHLTGYDLSLDDLKSFRQFGAKTPGHPEYGETPGIETTTGPLGQGLATGVGMALAQKIMAARWGEDVFTNNTYVCVGDGCLMEGISHEAAEFAGHMKLSKLYVLFDDNDITIDGPTSLSTSTDILARFESYGFFVQTCDGHDHQAIRNVFEIAQQSEKPSFIAFKTTIGRGAPTKQNTAAAHGSPLGEAELKAAKKALGWAHGPFEVPTNIYDAWREIADNAQIYTYPWDEHVNKMDIRQQEKLMQTLKREAPKKITASLEEFKLLTSQDKPKVATRKASGSVLDILSHAMPELISGSADLTPSNNTQSEGMRPITWEDFSGNYLHYGVREHAMAAIMNGLSLYGGLQPVGGTFLCFVDYLRPALRLSALMDQKVVYVMTHDSIGLGEDGPTHQPVEHLAGLRATPNVLTFRPADQVETAECWQHALEKATGPSVMALSRQSLPTVRVHHTEENLSARGGYILSDIENPRENDVQGIFIATGSEVHLALEAQRQLHMEGLNVRVVSMPCVELFRTQDPSYQEQVLPSGVAARVVIEAACESGWEGFMGPYGRFIGINHFGASAPAADLFEKAGITTANARDTMSALITELMKNTYIEQA